MSRRRASRSRTARRGLAAALLVVAAGCTRVPSNAPEAYDDTVEGDPVPIVEQNFMALCLDAQSADDEVTDAARELCGCMYELIVDEVPFDRFEEYDQQLADDPTDLPEQYQDIADRAADGECADSSSSESEATTTTDGGGG